MRVFLAIAWLSNGVNGDFQEMGTGRPGFILSHQNGWFGFDVLGRGPLLILLE